MDAHGRPGPRPLVLDRRRVLTPAALAERIKASARTAGFAAVGVASAEPAGEGRALRDWLARGYHAGMAWMANPDVRENPAALLPGARSVVVVGWNSWLPAAAPGPGEGRIARYARWPDYHGFMRRRLARVLADLKGVVPCRGRIVVDAAPLLERAFAARAGLGWAGRHACLIAPRGGSWLLLGELILDVAVAPDAPQANRCGTCDRCAPACPTGAIVAPGVVDANRCLAYLTIEHRGPIPAALRPALGDWLFGCDLCQEACPWDRFAAPQTDRAPRLPAALEAAAFLRMDDAEFRARSAGTALKRAGREGMARNAAIVLGNTVPGMAAGPRRDEALAALAAGLAEDPSPVVRGACAWALSRCGAREALAAARARETDPLVTAELGSGEPVGSGAAAC